MRRVVLHAGQLDLDTLAVQRTLKLNEAALTSRGHSRILRRAVLDGVASPAWQRLVERAHSPGDGDVYCADSGLGHLPPAQLAALLADLASVPVTVVLTARPLAAAIPALWVERLRRGGETRVLHEFVTAVMGDEGATDAIAPALDWTAAVARWLPLVGREHVTVITLPGSAVSGWQRFCEAVGLEPEGLASPAAVPQFGALTAEIMRRVNLRAGDNAPLRHSVTPRADEPRLQLSEAVLESCRKVSEARTSQLLDSGVAIVGDISDLVTLPMPDDQGTATPETLPTEALLDTAIQDLIDLAAPLQPSAETLA
jgi:hypothetical protein